MREEQLPAGLNDSMSEQKESLQHSQFYPAQLSPQLLQLRVGMLRRGRYLEALLQPDN